MFVNPVLELHFDGVGLVLVSGWGNKAVSVGIIEVILHDKADVFLSFNNGRAQVLVTGDYQKVWAGLQLLKGSLLMREQVGLAGSGLEELLHSSSKVLHPGVHIG